MKSSNNKIFKSVIRFKLLVSNYVFKVAYNFSCTFTINLFSSSFNWKKTKLWIIIELPPAFLPLLDSEQATADESPPVLQRHHSTEQNPVSFPSLVVPQICTYQTPVGPHAVPMHTSPICSIPLFGVFVPALPSPWSQLAQNFLLRTFLYHTTLSIHKDCSPGGIFWVDNPRQPSSVSLPQLTTVWNHFFHLFINFNSISLCPTSSLENRHLTFFCPYYIFNIWHIVSIVSFQMNYRKRN